MRLIAHVIPNVEGIKRLMIHETEMSVYLFCFNRMPDGGGMGDEWYETVADAKAAAQEAYQVSSDA